MNKVCINDIELFNKRVLLRADFNLPYNSHGEIIDFFRVEASLQTIEYALEVGARSIIIISHMARPKGLYVKQFSLEPVAKILEKLLQKKVIFLSDCVGDNITKFCENSPNGSIILLENLRFHIEETGTGIDINGREIHATTEEITRFEANLRKLGDIYVNDAFSTSHRTHTSMLLKNFEIRVCGFLLKSEIEYFSKALDPSNIKKPYLVIIAGNKVSDKLPAIENILEIADDVIIAGGMAYSALYVLKNMKVGSTLIFPETKEVIKKIAEKAEKLNVKLHFPLDFIITNQLDHDGTVSTADANMGIPDGWIGLDIGPKSLDYFSKIIYRSRTIIWNGPVGAVKYDQFCSGTIGIIRAVEIATRNGAFSILGGGRTAFCALKWSNKDKFSHISTGGGATLRLLEGKKLPAVEALPDK